MASPIRLDCSAHGIVVYCSECGHWSAFRFSKSEAWAAAIGHEALVHPERREQRDAADVRNSRERHAV